MSEGKSYPVQQMPPQQDPPPPYQTGPQQPPPVVVTTQPVPMYTNPARMFRDVPVPVKCMYCSADIVTATSFETGMLTWLACGMILLIGLGIPLLWLGCCFIPFCIPSLKDVIHTCPNCNQMVGRYNRLSQKIGKVYEIMKTSKTVTKLYNEHILIIINRTEIYKKP